jgi:hypothetical protein
MYRLRTVFKRIILSWFGDRMLPSSPGHSKNPPKRNALPDGRAKEGAVAYSTSDNRRTYTSQNAISFAGSNFYIHDKQDAFRADRGDRQSDETSAARERAPDGIIVLTFHGSGGIDGLFE